VRNEDLNVAARVDFSLAGTVFVHATSPVCRTSQQKFVVRGEAAKASLFFWHAEKLIRNSTNISRHSTG
jgi:hypothetical protein